MPWRNTVKGPQVWPATCCFASMSMFMYRSLFVIAIVAGCLGSAGCTSTEPVIKPGSSTAAVHAIESTSHDQAASLTLEGGRTVSAARITVGADTVQWVHPSTQNRRAVPTDCVSAVQFTRHGRGLLDGLGIGIAASLGAGALTAALPSALGRCEGLAALACGFAAIAVTVGGTIGGAVAGAVRGHRDVYTFGGTAPASSNSCHIQSLNATGRSQ